MANCHKDTKLSQVSLNHSSFPGHLGNLPQGQTVFSNGDAGDGIELLF